MHSPTDPDPTNLAKRRRSSVLLSFALHVGVLALVVLLGTVARTRVIEPADHPALALLENAGGSHAVKIPLPPSNFAAHTRKPTNDSEASRKSIVPIEQPQRAMSGGGAPKAPHTGDGSNQALSGNGSDAEDARPAFPTYSPRPPVTDRSLLPHSEVKIVVDVDLDALGQVVHETLVKGMGTKLDQIVLDTVRTWRFQPATVNGKPVPSEDELIFPFNPSYPITDS
ncbi:MAG TPA: energy transducer TonB [Terracidiphilus sp.]|jgi:TonB family protein|nr:energy transducer TonB [Terracidiphilus sp.]